MEAIVLPTLVTLLGLNSLDLLSLAIFSIILCVCSGFDRELRLPVYPKYLPIKGEPIIMPKVVGKPRVRKSLVGSEPPPRAKRPESLTSREQEILELIWAGFKNKEIGHRLKISVKTVEAHRANMMKKMRVSNTAQLLKTAIQVGSLKIR